MDSSEGVVIRGPYSGEVPAFEFPHLTATFERIVKGRPLGPSPCETWGDFECYILEFTSQNSYLSFESSRADAHLVVYDVDVDGSCRHSHLPYLPSVQSRHVPGTMRSFIASCIERLVEVTCNLQFRLVMVDARGLPAIDLYTMDMLHGAFGIDIELLWYIFKESNEMSMDGIATFSEWDPPIFMDGLHIPWANTTSFEIGSMHVLLLDGQQSPLNRNIPLAIMIFQREVEPRSGYNPYGSSPFSSMSDNYSHAPVELVQRAIRRSSLFKACSEVETVYHETDDLRKCFLIAMLNRSRPPHNKGQFRQCLQAMIQYQIACGRSVLVGHLSPDRNIHKDEATSQTKAPSLSWRLLRRLLQRLEQQYIMLLRLRKCDRFPCVGANDLDTEIDEFEFMLQEIKAVVSERRDKLDHELNETLLRESRTNLKIAQQSMKESQQSGLLTFLAFIFVPFSLATSVFGMNIQELNQNGQSLTTFIATGLVLFAVSLILYATASVINVARNNFKDRSRILNDDLEYIEDKSVFSKWEEHWFKAFRLRWSPSRCLSILRRGLWLGVISRGRFDPKAYELSHQDVDIQKKEAEIELPIKTRLFQELKYFLGLNRLPQDEDQNIPWKVRSDTDLRAKWWS